MNKRLSSRRPRRAEILDAVIAAGLAVAAIITTVQEDRGPWLTLAGIAMTGPLLIRRTRPVAAAVVMALVMVAQALITQPPEQVWLLIAVIIASYSLGAFESSLRLALLGLVALATAVSVGIARDDTDSLSNILPTLLIFIVAPWGAGRALHQRDRDARQLSAQVGALETERDVLAREAVVAERARIARELHDVVAHSLSVIAIQADAAEGALAKDLTRAREPLAAVKLTAREALKEMRHLLGLLRDDAGDTSLEPQPGLQSLDALVEQVRSAGLSVDLSVVGPERALSPGADLSAYRLVQEALTNTLKHANASRATVEIRHTEAAVELTVTDDGSGTGSGDGTGHGLVGMQERVALYGGSLAVGPIPGGFRVKASLPR